MNEIPVVFSFDENLIIGAYVSIMSLIDNANSDTQYHIHILHKNLKKFFIEEFKKLNLGRHSIEFVQVGQEYFQNAPCLNYGLTEAVYYRLLIPIVLPKYDKVIYSDVDVLFQDDLWNLYNTNLDDYEVMALKTSINEDTEANRNIGKVYFPENTNKYQYNSGVLIFNSKLMRQEKTVDKFFEAIEKYHDRIKFFDQDILNIVCTRFKDLPLNYNVFQPLYYKTDIDKTLEYNIMKSVYKMEDFKNAKKNAVIIHYAGSDGKPWTKKNPPEEYKKYLDTIPKELNYLNFKSRISCFWGHHPIIKAFARFLKNKIIKKLGKSL